MAVPGKLGKENIATCDVLALGGGVAGCNICVDSCRSGVLIPSPENCKPPIVLYPDECWFCGCCVGDCPVPGPSRLQHPLSLRNAWKRKDTEQTFRLGMKNPPPPNTRPPVG